MNSSRVAVVPSRHSPDGIANLVLARISPHLNALRAMGKMTEAAAELVRIADEIRGLAGQLQQRDISTVFPPKIVPPSFGFNEVRLEYYEATSPEMQVNIGLAMLAARSRLSVAIEGDTGCGKTWLARAIHNSNPAQANAPFCLLDVGNISDSLIDAQLFGHKKGAFTGALTDSEGIVASAHGGTLFLDDFSDLSLDAQKKLLQVLETKTYRRVGDTQERISNFRLIVASRHPLEQLLKDGKLREDLYFRLRGIEIKLPTLKERINELPKLVEGYLQRLACENGRDRTWQISAAAIDLLKKQPWPGNLRELFTCLALAVELATSDELQVEDLPIGEGFRNRFKLTSATTLGSRSKALAPENVSPPTVRADTAVQNLSRAPEGNPSSGGQTPASSDIPQALPRANFTARPDSASRGPRAKGHRRESFLTLITEALAAHHQSGKAVPTIEQLAGKSELTAATARNYFQSIVPQETRSAYRAALNGQTKKAETAPISTPTLVPQNETTTTGPETSVRPTPGPVSPSGSPPARSAQRAITADTTHRATADRPATGRGTTTPPSAPMVRKEHIENIFSISNSDPKRAEKLTREIFAKYREICIHQVCVTYAEPIIMSFVTFLPAGTLSLESAQARARHAISIALKEYVSSMGSLRKRIKNLICLGIWNRDLTGELNLDIRNDAVGKILVALRELKDEIYFKMFFRVFLLGHNEQDAARTLKVEASKEDIMKTLKKHIAAVLSDHTGRELL